MAEPNKRRPAITETVADLDGQKVLVIKADDRIVAVQTATTVAQRIDNLATIVEAFDKELAKSDADHLAAAEKRIDDQIAGLQSRKAALTADGVGAAAKARIHEKRVALVGQQTELATALAAMGGDPRPVKPEAPR